MIIPIQWENNLKSHIVTPYMLGAVIYSYNKRAKNMRDKEREYRRYQFYGCGRDKEKCSKKKELYYSRKDVLLGFESPCAVHIVERIGRHRIYDYQSEYNNARMSGKDIVYRSCYWDEDENREVRFCDIAVPFQEYYLYYKIGDYTFHSPIENLDNYELPVVNIGDLQTRGLPTNQLLSLRNCDRIYRGLKNGSLSYVCDAA